MKFAESTALVFATKERIVVPLGIPVPVIVAPLNHPSVLVTVIFGDPLVAVIFWAVSKLLRKLLLIHQDTLTPSVISDLPALPV